MSRPHIVCIILDTLRYGHSASMDYHRDTTPFLDTMAEQGWRFSRLYANGPWTVPSHGALFTGLDPICNGANYPHLSLDPGVPTLAEVLHDAGYFCAAFSNNPWVGKKTGLHRGFDYFDDTWRAHAPKSQLQTAWRAAKRLFLSTDKGARSVQDRLEDALTARPEDRPLFLFINFMDVHPVCTPPPRYLQRFKGEHYRPHWMWNFAKGYYKSAYYYAGQWSLTEEQWRNFIWLYDAAIAYLDDHVRLLYERLYQNLGENLAFIVTSDHGDSFDDHGHLGHQFSLYQNLLHVPGWAFGKSLEGGEEVQGALQLSDLFYAICDVAGAMPPRPARLSWETGGLEDGCLFFDYGYPELQLSNFERALPGREFSALERAIYGLYRKPYKYIAYFNSGLETQYPEVELLFNLQDDPSEESNQVGRHEDVLSGFRQRLREHLSERITVTSAIDDDEIVEQRLKALGYL